VTEAAKIRTLFLKLSSWSAWFALLRIHFGVNSYSFIRGSSRILITHSIVGSTLPTTFGQSSC